MESPWGIIQLTVPFVVLPHRQHFLVIIRQLRYTIKRLISEVSNKMPQALKAPVIQIDHRVYLAVEVVWGVGEGQEGNGCMDEVIYKLDLKRP